MFKEKIHVNTLYTSHIDTCHGEVICSLDWSPVLLQVNRHDMKYAILHMVYGVWYPKWISSPILFFFLLILILYSLLLSFSHSWEPKVFYFPFPSSSFSLMHDTTYPAPPAYCFMVLCLSCTFCPNPIAECVFACVWTTHCVSFLLTPVVCLAFCLSHAFICLSSFTFFLLFFFLH